MSYRWDQSGLQCDTPYLKQPPPTKIKHKFLLVTIINSNKQIKIQCAVCQAMPLLSIPVTWLAQFDCSISHSPWIFQNVTASDSTAADYLRARATRLLCYPSHWAQIFPAFGCVGEVHPFLQWLQSPKWVIWFCFSLSVHRAVSLCYLTFSA